MHRSAPELEIRESVPLAPSEIGPAANARPAKPWKLDVLDELVADPRDLVLRLTLLLLIFHAEGSWHMTVPIRLVAILAFLRPSILAHPIAWLLPLVACSVVAAPNWYVIDNHRYLLVYWVAACTLATSSATPLKVLEWNARVLVAISFTMATIWKIRTEEFVDGRFFSFLFVTDPRVEEFASFVTKMGSGLLQANRETIALALLAPQEGLRIVLHSSASLDSISRALVVWTLVIEGLIAIAFLAPASRFPRLPVLGIRNVLLLIFIATTYPIVPVTGFAFLLCVFGAASSAADLRWIKAFAVATVATVLLDVPWQAMLV